MNKFYVSRQHYYYSGQYAVEIASGGLDYSGCDMLCADKYCKGLEGEYDNPIEAAKNAIELRKLWQEREEDNHIYLAYGSNLDMFEGECNEDKTPEEEEIELMEWANTIYNELEKCDQCGDILPDDYYTLIDYDDDVKFCREYCAEKYESQLYVEDEEDDEEENEDE